VFDSVPVASIQFDSSVIQSESNDIYHIDLAFTQMLVSDVRAESSLKIVRCPQSDKLSPTDLIESLACSITFSSKTKM
jgi:hypothetical protein